MKGIKPSYGLRNGKDKVKITKVGKEVFYLRKPTESSGKYEWFKTNKIAVGLILSVFILPILLVFFQLLNR